jgi:hypothetical protein
LAIGAAVGYMAIFIIVIASAMSPVSAATFLVNESEGTFRFMHARLKEFAECGESGASKSITCNFADHDGLPVGSVFSVTSQLSCTVANKQSNVGWTSSLASCTGECGGCSKFRRSP